MTPYVRHSVAGDVDCLALRLRQSDAVEIAALSGRDPHTSLSEGLLLSRPCLTVVGTNDTPVAMFGVVPVSPGLGCIWLLGSDELESPKVARTFLRHCHKWVDGLGKKYPVMFNFAHFSNTKTIRWLRWLGFEFTEEPRIIGVKAEPFYIFQRKLCANRQRLPSPA